MGLRAGLCDDSHMSTHPDRLGLRRRAGPYRSRTDRALSGTAAGIADALGVDPLVVRAAFAVLALAGGAGVLLYSLAWLLLPEAPERHRPRTARLGPRGIAGVACITGSMLILFRMIGWWFGDAVVWPVALTCVGAIVILSRDDERASALGRRGAHPLRDTSPLRIVAGALLVVAGIAAFFITANVGIGGIGRAAFPLIVAIAGLALIFGPWLLRLTHQLTEERRERIRSEERAEVAAHLHDSVLQTLSLIQRADSPRRMSSLARAQERELRTWLYGRPGSVTGGSLAAAVETLAGRAETLHEIEVEVVVVGDTEIDDRLSALVYACGEALTNAALHSGARSVSLYVETQPDDVTAFVRDAGKGFDPDQIPDDRRGIKGSIVERIERAGGKVTITSTPGEGTEVMMRVPRVTS